LNFYHYRKLSKITPEIIVIDKKTFVIELSSLPKQLAIEATFVDEYCPVDQSNAPRMEILVLDEAARVEEEVVPGEGSTGRSKHPIAAFGIVLHESIQLLCAVGNVQGVREVKVGSAVLVLDHLDLLYRERLIETSVRRERLRDRRMNCCVSALSEWPYTLNIAFTGILIQNLVKQTRSRICFADFR
jgi:hypothetical protein